MYKSLTNGLVIRLPFLRQKSQPKIIILGSVNNCSYLQEVGSFNYCQPTGTRFYSLVVSVKLWSFLTTARSCIGGRWFLVLALMDAILMKKTILLQFLLMFSGLFDVC